MFAFATAEGMMRNMTSLSEPLICRRCLRPVEVSRGQFEVFEKMHYVCFHYEFEHYPADPDEECTAGGCPSAAISTAPSRGSGGCN